MIRPIVRLDTWLSRVITVVQLLFVVVVVLSKCFILSALSIQFNSTVLLA